MLRISKLSWIAAMSVMAMLLCAGGAAAATTIGMTFTPLMTTSPSALSIQTASTGSTPYVVPHAGVITSFSHIAETSPDAKLQLVVARPAGSNYFVVGTSTPKTLTASSMNTFAERIPVQAGDLLGAQGDTSMIGVLSPGTSGDVIGITPSLAFTGGTLLGSVMSPGSSLLIDISAQVETDADADGFGDETQDLCPTDKTTQGACNTAGPKLTLTAATTQKTKSSFSFSAVSDEASSATVDGTLTYYVKKNGKKKKKTIKLAPVAQSLLAGVSSKFSFTLSSKAKSALKKSGKLKVALSIVSTDVKGNKSTNTLSLTIKRK